MSRVVWYFAEKGETHGPLPWDGLQAAVQEGRLTKEGSVWSPGVDDWVPSDAVPWLIRAAAPASTEAETNFVSGSPAAQHLVTSPPPVKSVGGWRWKWPSAKSPITRLGLQRAPLTRRIAAATIDFLFASMIAYAVAKLVFLLLRRSDEFVSSATTDSVVGGVGVACLLLYHVTLEAFNGTTFGRSLMKCRIVDSHGDPPFATRIVARNLLRVWLFIWTARSIKNWVEIAYNSNFFTEVHLPWTLHQNFAFALIVVFVPLMIGERRPLHDVLAGYWLVKTPRSTKTT